MIQIQSPRDILVVLKRRYRYLVIPLVLGLAASVVASVFWPPTYRSVATILIEASNIPGDLIDATVDTYADHRVQVITQRVMTTSNLVSIIDRLDLYSDDRSNKAVSQIAEKMRKDISLELVNAEGANRQKNRRVQQTIAFTLSFDYGDPDTARRALEELVTLYLDENVRTRREQVSETVELLSREVDNKRLTVEHLEAGLATFKEQNAGKLPDQILAKQRQQDQIQRELLDVAKRLEALDEKRIYLSAQMAQVDPVRAPVKDMAQWSAAEKLRALQSEYLTLSSRYGPEHPDVLKASRELESLEAEVQAGGGRIALEAQRDALRSQLATLTGTYSDAYPEVLRVNRELETVEERLRNAPIDSSHTNPLLIQLSAQLASADAEYRALLQQRKTRQGLLEKHEGEIGEGPQIEREYRALVREYESALATYTDVQSKKRRAELGEAMEAQKKTEQFNLLEAPTLPIDAVAPDVKTILVIGAVLSLLVAVGAAVLSEVMDYSIYGARQLTEIAGVPPLVVIPRIRTSADNVHAWKVRIAGAVGGLIVIALALMLKPELIGTLNGLWESVEQGLIEFGANRTFDS
jgi:uncharacterized protein involved in exopolysaccharide biosynthesis